MIFIAKCPLRIGLVGGSTDLEEFIQKYEIGKVISFPTTLNVYISVHDNNRNLYIVNYSSNEEHETIDDIHNDVARIVLKHFRVGPVTISFLSDIISTGSGLASSTAYMIAAIKALSLYAKKHLTEFEICKLAIELERKYNTHTGYQDAYGCGVGGFKKISFPKNKSPIFIYFNTEFIRANFDMVLYHTGISRNSTQVLKSYNTDNCYHLLEKADLIEEAIENKNVESFLKVFNESWKIKKRTSNSIANSVELKEWDKALESNQNILARKLLGAGGGGYFFALCKKGKAPKQIKNSVAINININENGVVGVEL